MSFHEETRAEIAQILEEAFAPLKLTVEDESAAHRGHREAIAHPGAGHFKVEMVSSSFTGLNPVERHRLVYKKLSSLMDSRIHALKMKLMAPDEV